MKEDVNITTDASRMYSYRYSSFLNPSYLKDIRETQKCTYYRIIKNQMRQLLSDWN